MTEARRATRETECAICGWHTPCRDNGETYACVDTEACTLYQRINTITLDRNALTEQRDALLTACKAAHRVLLTFERLGLLKQDFEQQTLESVRTAIAKVYGS
jgi:hypothetical protein